MGWRPADKLSEPQQVHICANYEINFKGTFKTEDIFYSYIVGRILCVGKRITMCLPEMRASGLHQGTTYGC